MATIMSAIRTSVLEQQKHIALINCVEGWDGAVTAETVIQGIQDRYAAMGARSPALRLQRTDLKTVVIETRTRVIGYFVKSEGCDVPLGKIMDSTRVTLDSGDSAWVWLECPHFFNTVEVKQMAEFLLNEFHHA